LRFLASVRWRIFLVSWILLSVHFATNVSREFFPAFSLVEDGTLKVDKYEGFHGDIFRHRDGHLYIGNNVAVSFVVAVPLLVFDPVLDVLEDVGKRHAQANEDAYIGYRVDKPNSQAFYRLVRQRGLHLRLGGATAITAVFLLAPLSALTIVLMYHIFTLRGVPRGRAIGLAFIFGFGTPLFFRTAPLNQNIFLMYAFFLAFFILWRGSDDPPVVPLSHRVLAGFLGGFTLAADYAGTVLLLSLYAYLFFRRLSTASWKQSFVESLAFVAGSVPPVLFLLATQWIMYGSPFFPGQYWEKGLNYVDRGWRGFSLPAPDLFLKNLFDPAYGMYVFGPLLILGLIPTWRYRGERLILPRAERRFVAAMVLVFLLFCAANQYARLQWNTGFRYLIPLVPFIFLQASDHLARMPRKLLVGIAAVAIFHSWVLASVREPLFESYRILLHEGVQLPWLRVLRLTSPPGASIVSSPLLPVAVLGFALLLAWGVWRFGARLEAGQAASASDRGAASAELGPPS